MNYRGGTVTMRVVRGAVMTCAALLAASSISAQMTTPSAAADAMAGSHVARVRGFAAIAGNPAGLAMPGGPRRSATIMSLRGFAGLDPIGLGDIAEYGGENVSAEVREGWLQRIAAAGGEEGAAGVDATLFAIQEGRFGLHLSTGGHIDANLAPGAAELVLFGNAGRTGEAADISLSGSSMDAVVATAIAVAYAHPIIDTDERAVSVGATMKYLMGHILVSAFDVEGEATADPLAIGVEFPIVQSGENMVPITDRRGSGWGMDLGVAWRERGFEAGLTVRDLFSTFEWDRSLLVFRPGTISVTEDERATDFTARPIDEAPESVRSRARAFRPSPTIAAGVAFSPGRDWVVAADVRQRLGDEPRADPPLQVGAGAEYRPLSWLPLRAGAALVTEGYHLSTGAGLQFASVGLDVAVARRRTDVGSGTLASVTFSFGTN